MSALFPNVPIAAGVPAVLRKVSSLTAAVDALPTSDDAPAPGSESWGVFGRDGSRLVASDSTVSLEYHAENRIADYPMEGGGFQSYNKVQTPVEVHVVMTKGGSVGDRTDFLNALEALRESLAPCDVATPEYVYVGVNVTRLSQSRSAEAGAGMATVEVVLEEIRETVAVAYSVAPPTITNTATDAATASPASTNATSASPAPSQPSPAIKAIGNPFGKAFSPGATVGAAAARIVNQGSVQPRASGENISRLADGTVVFDFKGMK